MLDPFLKNEREIFDISCQEVLVFKGCILEFAVHIPQERLVSFMDDISIQVIYRHIPLYF